MRLRLPAILSGLALLAALGGCASNDKTGTMLVSPSRFTLYNCKELAYQQTQSVTRQRELEGLIARAKQDASGGLVSAIAYEPEHQSVLGELKVLRQEAKEKNCNLPDPDAVPPPVAAAAAKPANPAKPKR